MHRVVDPRDHVGLGHLKGISAKKFGVVLLADVLHDRLRLRQLDVSVYEERQIREIKTKVKLLILPVLATELWSISLVEMLHVIVNSAVGQ